MLPTHCYFQFSFRLHAIAFLTAITQKLASMILLHSNSSLLGLVGSGTSTRIYLFLKTLKSRGHTDLNWTPLHLIFECCLCDPQSFWVDNYPPLNVPSLYWEAGVWHRTNAARLIGSEGGSGVGTVDESAVKMTLVYERLPEMRTRSHNLQGVAESHLVDERLVAPESETEGRSIAYLQEATMGSGPQAYAQTGMDNLEQHPASRGC